MEKIYKNVTFNIDTSHSVVEYGESFVVTLKASGLGAKPGLKIPYRVLNGPTPYGSDIVLLDFTYDVDTDYYYLTAKLSEPLGTNTLEVSQIGGPLVLLEKVSDTIYKYKNPLDREEVSRSFRATLKSYATKDNMVKGVRAFDFIYSNEYGYFELDSNLTSTKTFKNKMSLLSPIDRLFNLSLYYMPQYTINTLFKNNYTPPEPYPPKPILENIKLSVTALEKNAYEGGEASFKVSYTNVRKNFKLYYQYIDSKDNYNQEGYFYTDETGFFIITAPIGILEINNSNSRYLKLWLKEYPKISDVVYINTLPKVDYYERFIPGNYTITLQPFGSYEITLIGAGGSGGAYVSNRGGNWAVNASGGDGGDTFVTVGDFTCIASGGKGGSDAHWHNGSSFSTGVPGKGGINNVFGIGSVFVIKTNTNGKDGIFALRGQQQGAEAITDLGDVGYNGAGAKGGWGGGDENLSPGGSSGSGGLVICTIRNDTSRTKELKLTVGSAGTLFDLGAAGTWGNSGSKGENGFAIIKSL